jgi:hypothetical protein
MRYKIWSGPPPGHSTRTWLAKGRLLRNIAGPREARLGTSMTVVVIETGSTSNNEMASKYMTPAVATRSPIVYQALS